MNYHKIIFMAIFFNIILVMMMGFMTNPYALDDRALNENIDRTSEFEQNFESEDGRFQISTGEDRTGSTVGNTLKWTSYVFNLAWSGFFVKFSNQGYTGIEEFIMSLLGLLRYSFVFLLALEVILLWKNKKT